MSRPHLPVKRAGLDHVLLTPGWLTKQPQHDSQDVQARPACAGQASLKAEPGAELAAGGRAALASKGAGGARCKLTPAQLGELEAALDAGPAAPGWEDQCWTLARIGELVWRQFRVE